VSKPKITDFNMATATEDQVAFYFDVYTKTVAAAVGGLFASESIYALRSKAEESMCRVEMYAMIAARDAANHYCIATTSRACAAADRAAANPGGDA
jgi:hypothetical protein